MISILRQNTIIHIYNILICIVVYIPVPYSRQNIQFPCNKTDLVFPVGNG